MFCDSARLNTQQPEKDHAYYNRLSVCLSVMWCIVALRVGDVDVHVVF